MTFIYIQTVQLIILVYTYITLDYLFKYCSLNSFQIYYTFPRTPIDEYTDK